MQSSAEHDVQPELRQRLPIESRHCTAVTACPQAFTRHSFVSYDSQSKGRSLPQIHNVNRLGFVTETQGVFCEVETSPHRHLYSRGPNLRPIGHCLLEELNSRSLVWQAVPILFPWLFRDTLKSPMMQIAFPQEAQPAGSAAYCVRGSCLVNSPNLNYVTLPVLLQHVQQASSATLAPTAVISTRSPRKN